MAARHERIHGQQQLRLAPEEADGARSQHLVAADRHEVGAERLHVDPLVRRRLRGVGDVDRAALVRPGGDPRNVVGATEDIRDVARWRRPSRSRPPRARRARRAGASRPHRPGASGSRRPACARCTARGRSSHGARAP